MKNNIVLAAICAAVIVLSAVWFLPGIASTEKQMPRANTQTECDVPTWHVGDSWRYHEDSRTDFTSGNMQNSWLEFHDDWTYRVTAIENFVYNGTTYLVYNLTMTDQSWSGHYHIVYSGMAIDNDFRNTQMAGYKLVRCSDLATVMEYMYRYGEATPDLVIKEGNIQLWNTQVFDPITEDYDFPLAPGSNFLGNTTVRLIGKIKYRIVPRLGSPAEGESTWDTYQFVQRVITVTGPEDVTVTAGTFSTFKAHSDMVIIGRSSSYDFYYNSTVGNEVKRVGTDIPYTKDSDMDSTRTLTSYNRVTPATTITARLNPASGYPGTQTHLRGSVAPVPSSPTTIVVTPPEFPSHIWQGRTDGGGNFDIVITIPPLIDSTPTNYDIGSVGLLVYIEGSRDTTYTVTTLTVLGIYRELFYNFAPGWNLFSVTVSSLTETYTTLPELLAAYGVPYATIMSYDAGVWTVDNWNKPAGRPTIALNTTKAYWVYLNTSYSFRFGGLVAPSTTIKLKKGWNLVGFPSKDPKRLGDALSSIMAYEPVIHAFSPTASYRLAVLADPVNDMLKPGEGYWLYVNADTNWVITN